MIRKITIATIGVLFSASLLFTLFCPLIPFALDVPFEEMEETMCRLIFISITVLFILGAILSLMCDFWKEKTKEDNYEKEN